MNNTMEHFYETMLNGHTPDGGIGSCPIFPDKTDGPKVHTAHIIGQIKDIDFYIPLLNLLDMMTSEDSINIFIDSLGGYINSGCAISANIVSCKGKVRTIATGFCASAGSLIWSSGHECLCTPTANFMWHMSSHSDYGNSIEIGKEAKIQVEYVRNILLEQSCKKGHISKEEVEEICNDSAASKAIWISARQMEERIRNYNLSVSNEYLGFGKKG